MQRALRALTIAALICQMVIGSSQRAKAAPGDVIVDMPVPETDGPLWPRGIAKAIGFDGHNLYYAEWAGPVLHRIDVPPAGSVGPVTGHTDIPVQGAPSGIMAISYDATRDLFWAVGGDGLSIYKLDKTTGLATLQFTIDPVADRPGNCKVAAGCSNEAKINYDGADDTIWYGPDASPRLYHYSTTPDMLGTASIVAATPYIDVDVFPNDMYAECGYNQSSGFAVGGDGIFIGVISCPYLFEYSKTGVKLGKTPISVASSGDLECDNLSYGVSVIWARGGWDGHIRAYEQPAASACAYGGGPRVP